MGEKFLSTFPCSSKSDPQREFFGHRHRRIEWGAPMRPLKRAFPCYFFFYLFRDKRHLLQKQKCSLKCHMRDRNPLQCQIKTWFAVSSWGQQNVRRVAKSLTLYFCSQFWGCNHVSSNPLDPTWQMAPWQKEGVWGSIIVGFLFSSWLHVLAAIKKEWGIFWCFQQREIQLAVIWCNLSERWKMFNILPFWLFVVYRLA